MELPHYAKLHNGWDLCNKQSIYKRLKRPEIVTEVRLKGSLSNFWNIYSRDIWGFDHCKTHNERNVQAQTLKRGFRVALSDSRSGQIEQGKKIAREPRILSVAFGKGI